LRVEAGQLDREVTMGALPPKQARRKITRVVVASLAALSGLLGACLPSISFEQASADGGTDGSTSDVTTSGDGGPPEAGRDAADGGTGEAGGDSASDGGTGGDAAPDGPVFGPLSV
jgi:hypothetical protein